MSLTGDAFFYTNPLELNRKKYNHPAWQAVSRRAKVFDCSCCPPNVVRMLASVARYAYTVDGDKVYCNQFMSSETKLEIGGKEAVLTQTTHYPCDGKIRFDYHGAPMTLFVRIPDWCAEYAGKTESGFARFELTDGDSVTVDLPMQVHFVEANPNVQDDAGRYAVQCGPIVYCMEQVDNGENLRDITLLDNGSARVVLEEGIPAPVIYMDAQRRKHSDSLYRLKNAERIPFTARLIPYFAFANREDTDMLIWTMVQ